MKLIEIAEFPFPSEAGVLESIFQAENIPYFLNVNSSNYPPMPAILKIAESDKERAIEIMKEAGFENYLQNE
ncbi:MAG: DUF2007 domain-containing protein [Prevotellaceae bacterium]|jgi:hypothetical protein|nr:DUF2007 domain-containing protein [Prevotellaceae bacterium]